MEEDFLVFKSEPNVQKKIKTDTIDLQKIAPWIKKSTLKIKNPLVKMHNEIIEFFNYVSPSQDEHQQRQDAYQNIKTLIEENIENSELLVFGSFVTKLYLPNADIDCVVMQESLSATQLLLKVQKIIMKNQEMFENIQIIKNAKVPLIKFRCQKTQIQFDLSFNADDGIKQTYPEIKYLIMVMKCILKQRDLNETYKGGIGSFLLFCMILAFLRELRRQFIEKKKLKELQNLMLSELLLKMFEFYGIKFELGYTSIQMINGGDIYEKKTYDNGFSLISPQDTAHDIGNAAFKIKDVFSVMKNRFNFMTNYNFKEDESVFQYIVNPGKQVFTFYKE